MAVCLDTDHLKTWYGRRSLSIASLMDLPGCRPIVTISVVSEVQEIGSISILHKGDTLHIQSFQAKLQPESESQTYYRIIEVIEGVDV